MSDDVLIYHPPRKEPTIFNMSLLLGSIAGAAMAMLLGDGTLGFSSTLYGATYGGVLGSMEYFQTAKHQREGIPASKHGSIFNSGMAFGAVLGGLGALLLAPATATAATVSIAAVTSAAIIGISFGLIKENNRENTYNLALKQQQEKALQLEMLRAREPEKEKGIYKNIPDLKHETQADSKHQDAELARSRNAQSLVLQNGLMSMQ